MAAECLMLFMFVMRILGEDRMEISFPDSSGIEIIDAKTETSNQGNETIVTEEITFAIPLCNCSEIERMLVQLQKRQEIIIEEQENLKKQLADAFLPCGFIYTQLANQTSPDKLWPKYNWKNISNNWPGVFFRIAGGGALQFGSPIQDESKPALNMQTEVKSTTACSYSSYSHPNNWSGRIITGCLSEICKQWFGIIFGIKMDEIRPRNMSVYVWIIIC